MVTDRLQRVFPASRIDRQMLRAAATALLAWVLGGCAADDRAAGQPGSAPAQQLRLAFVTNDAADFWTIARKGCEQAERDLGVQVKFVIAADASAAEQKRIVDDLLAAGVDGIAISLVDAANQTAMIDAVAEQIPVVTQDSDAPDSKRLAYVGTDNIAAGRMAGELLKEALPDGGKVMAFVGLADAQNASERLAGLEQAIAGTRIELLGLLTDNTDRVRAKANVVDTLVRHPDIAAMVGLWAYNGPAILNAVMEAKRLDKVKIVAFDEEDETLAGVRAGATHASVVQQPYEMGRQSVATLAAALRGDTSAIPATKQIIIPVQAIRRDNVDDFVRQLNQRRGRTQAAAR